MRTTSIIALAGSIVLAGCGGGSETAGDANGQATANNPAPGQPRAAATAGWNAADACAIVDRKAVAAAAGSAVTASQLSGASPGGDGLAASSTCTFTLANGTGVGVLTRQSPVADATPAAIEAARTGGGMMPAAADIPGLGKAALWTKEVNSLQLFIDDTRYAAINVVKPAKGTDPKAVAITIAKSLL